MFCKRLRFIALVFSTASFWISLGACGRKNGRPVERLAIVPLENLSSDFGSDWIGRAAAEALLYDLASTPDVYAQLVESASDAAPVRATRVLQGYFIERNGRIEIHATLMDPRKSAAVGSFALSGPLSNGPLPLVNQIAKRVSPASRTFSTSNAAAFRNFGQALTATDRAQMVRAFESAIAADPHLATASMALARLLAESGDRDQALKFLDTAQNAASDPIDRARLEFLAASLNSSTAAQLNALQALARLTPADPAVFKELAVLLSSQRKFQDAVRNFAAASRLDPDDAAIWNQLGYAYAFAQDLPGARRALERYRQLLPPEEVNPLDSLGEVSFYLGDFAAAEKYFLQAQQKNPIEFGGGELIKAAQARLMAGDLPQADALFRGYLALLQHSQGALAGYQEAQWEFLTGHRKAAMSRLEKLAPGLQGDAKALVFCQLSIWKLETGDSKAAADLASDAVASAQSPRLRSTSAICRYLSTMPATSSGSAGEDAYAKLFEQKFAQALPLLESTYRETNPTTDAQVRVLLAWSYVEVGKTADAGKLLDLYPIPLSSGEPLFASLIFPRYFYLRGAVLEKEGKRAEAKQNYELFLKYAGDLPSIFGDQAKVRQSIGAL